GVRPPGTGGRSAWTLRNIYAAHFAVTDEAGGRFFFTDRASRGAMSTAGAATDRYRVWVEDWSSSLQLNNSSTVQPIGARAAAKSQSPGAQSGTHHLRAAGGGCGLDLSLRPAKPPAVHGSRGVSQKSAGRGHASYYYSLTR